MNKYQINLQGVVQSTCTNDNNVVTGNQSPTWVGCAVTQAGAVGNAGANNGLIYNDKIVDSGTTTYLDKMVCVAMPQAFNNNADNYVQHKLSSLEFSKEVDIKGILAIGISGTGAVMMTANPAVLGALSYAVVKTNVGVLVLIIKIPQGQLANLAGKTLSLKIYYK